MDCGQFWMKCNLFELEHCSPIVLLLFWFLFAVSNSFYRHTLFTMRKLHCQFKYLLQIIEAVTPKMSHPSPQSLLQRRWLMQRWCLLCLQVWFLPHLTICAPRHRRTYSLQHPGRHDWPAARPLPATELQTHPHVLQLAGMLQQPVGLVLFFICQSCCTGGKLHSGLPWVQKLLPCWESRVVSLKPGMG